MSELPTPADDFNPYAAPQTIKPLRVSLRVWISRAALLLGCVAWLLFLVSLALPGAAPKIGLNSVQSTKGYLGYACAGFFWPFWPSNLLLITQPIWLAATIIQRLPNWAFHWLLWLLILSGCGAVAISRELFLDTGYYLWVKSFFLAALAWLMILFAPRHRPTLSS